MKRPYWIGVFCLLAALLVMFFSFRENGKTTNAKSRTFTLLTQEDTGSFLLQLRYGGEAAVNESGNKLNTITLDQTAPEAQINELVTDGVSAVLLYAHDDALVEKVQAACGAASLPMVLLGRRGNGVSYASGDEKQSGEQLLHQAVTGLHATEIVLMCDFDGDAVERLNGAMNAPEIQNVTIAKWYGWNMENQPIPADVQAMIARGACVLALTGEATLAAVKMRNDGPLSEHNPILGTDPGPDRVTVLENGNVAALSLPEPYPMGYLGAQIAERALSSGKVQNVLVAPKLVTLDTLYSAENVKVAFPLLQ